MKPLSTLIMTLGFTTLLAGCGGGGSGPSNLFEIDFEADQGRAAVAIDRNEITGYWETKDRDDYHVRMKVEENKLTFAGKCIVDESDESDSIVAQSDGDIVLNRDESTMDIVNEITETASKDGRGCWFSLPAVERDYELSEDGLYLEGFSSAFGDFTKLGELEQK